MLDLTKVENKPTFTRDEVLELLVKVYNEAKTEGKNEGIRSGYQNGYSLGWNACVDKQREDRLERLYGY